MVIHGTRESAFIRTYKTQGTGEIKATVGGQEFVVGGIDNFVPTDTSITQPSTQDIIISISDKDYDFNLNEGENFFFILTKETEEETYVIKTEEDD